MEKAAACYFALSATNNYMNLLHQYGQQHEKQQRQQHKKTKKRLWMMSMHKNRTRATMDQNIFTNLLCEPSNQYNGFIRMSATDFEELLNRVGPAISKKDTKFREAIPAKIRLAVTLRFLASGDSFRSLNYLFKISHQLISNIVREGCTAIVLAMKDMIKMPASKEEWLRKEAKFKDVFCHCLGALDGKQIVVLSPLHKSSKNYSHKHFASKVLLTLVDRDFCFIFFDVRSKGKINDGGVLKHCTLFEKIHRNTLNLPQPDPLPGDDVNMPYVFVADPTIPLQENLMTPYAGEHPEGSMERNFNDKLSSVRIVAENAFGIMSDRFRVLKKPLLLQPQQASMVVTACALLHNFLMQSRTSLHIYSPPGYADHIINGKVVAPGMWRQETVNSKSALRPIMNISSDLRPSAEDVRNKFAEYFTTKLISIDETFSKFSSTA